MNEYEYKLALAEHKTKRVEGYIDLGKRVISGMSIIGYIVAIFWGLHKFIGEDASWAMNIAKELKLGSVLGYITTAVYYFLYRKEKNGKKRAIELKGIYQQIAEKMDTSRTSSGLTEDGSTPES